MGYSLTWTAVRGLSLDEALERQGLAATPERSDYADCALAAMPWGDWTLIVARRCDPPAAGDAKLARLSMGCEVVVAAVEEHVMYSSSELWRDGRRQWRVEHDAQESVDHLVMDGPLPDAYEAIRSRFAALQDAEDVDDVHMVDHFFEIPLVLAQGLVGFKHDEVTGDKTDGKFIVLVDPVVATRVSMKAWWQFWK